MFTIGSQLPLFIWPAELYDEHIIEWGSVDINLGNLYEDKYSDCSDRFIDSCIYDGIQMPMCLMIGRYGPIVGNGHHRLSVAVEHNLVLPVIFDDSESFPGVSGQDHSYTESADFPNSWEAEGYENDEQFDSEYEAS